MLLASTFTAYCLTEDALSPPTTSDHIHISHAITACIYTTTVFIKMRLRRIQSHQSWWKIKIHMMHAIMIPYCLLMNSLSRVTSSIQHVILTISYPFLPILNVPVYWCSIWLTIASLLLYELSHLWSPRPMNNLMFIPCKHNFPFMFRSSGGYPVPRRLMALSSIALNQSFVGFLAKLGKHFLGFMHSMHRIGSNTILLLLLSSTLSFSITHDHYT